jgi:hypothetical protein
MRNDYVFVSNDSLETGKLVFFYGHLWSCCVNNKLASLTSSYNGAKIGKSHKEISLFCDLNFIYIDQSKTME